MGGSHDLTPGMWVAGRGRDVIASGATAADVVEWLQRHGERAETMYCLPTSDDPFSACDVGAFTPTREGGSSHPRCGRSAFEERLPREAERVPSDPADRDEIRRIREDVDSISADWPSEPA